MMTRFSVRGHGIVVIFQRGSEGWEVDETNTPDWMSEADIDQLLLTATECAKQPTPRLMKERMAAMLESWPGVQGVA